MVTLFSQAKITPAPPAETSWTARLSSILLLSNKERDALVTEIANLLDSPDRAEVLEALSVADIHHFVPPAPRDYEFYGEFQKACNEIRRLYNSLGIVQVSPDGKLIDRNTLHRPLTAEGNYYKNAPQD